MKIYANLFAYINQEETTEKLLHGSDRPVIVLDPSENIVSKSEKSLIPITKNVYELAIPHVQLSDWERSGELKRTVFLDIEYKCVELSVSDQVLDAELVPEEKQDKLKELLGKRFDRSTGDIIKIFVGIFSSLLGSNRTVDVPLLSLYEKLETLSQEEARLPLVVYLERKYQLKRKLELISPKLRSQLRRQAELVPIGRLQEMNAYCLRDYTRRPGKDAIEKAGSRQMLMGLQRYQEFNTPENRFLVGFSDLLHTECLTYKQHDDAKRLGMAIDRFRQEPNVQTIQKSPNLLDKPNYVLQQNPIYRSFYEACLEFIKKRTEKDDIWSYRHHLASDVVGMLIISAIIQLQGAFLKPNDKIKIRSVAEYGEYLVSKCMKPITCFTQTCVYTFSLFKKLDEGHITMCDWLLDIDIQDLNILKRFSNSIPIWVFWDRPSVSCMASAINYLKQADISCGVLIYIQERSEPYPTMNNEESNLIISVLPDLMDENNNGLLSCVDYMANLFIQIINRLNREKF